jgi:hypothetical protein
MKGASMMLFPGQAGKKSPAEIAGEEGVKPGSTVNGREWLLILAVLVLSLALGRLALAADPWPRYLEAPEGTVVMYQPQLEDFQDDKLTARAALSVQTKEMKDPVFGVVLITARVQTDRDRLNRDLAARQRGATRTQNYQRATAPPVSRPSGGISRPDGGAPASRGGAGGAGAAAVAGARVMSCEYL